MRRPNLLAGKAPADGRWLKEPAGKAFSGAPENGGLAGKELWLCVAQVCLPARNFGYASPKSACRQGTLVMRRPSLLAGKELQVVR